MEYRVNIYIQADAMITSLGFSTQDNLKAIEAYESGIKLREAGVVSDQPLQAGLIDRALLRERTSMADIEGYTIAEQLLLLVVKELTEQTGILSGKERVGLVLSTTKGNIDQLCNNTDPIPDSAFLSELTTQVGDYFNLTGNTHLVSNACISGLSAMIIAKRYIETGKYDKVIVAGVDVLSNFITSGFLSFKSVSEQCCRPYDASRNGLNLGEGAAALLLGKERTADSVLFAGGAVSNDANHISGPSRTGDGLFFAIEQAMREAGVAPEEVGLVNTHGTATIFNDEMEAKALALAGLERCMLNSVKPYVGHTLGASGIVETIIAMHELKQGIAYGTPGYKECGVSIPVNTTAKHRNSTAEVCVKTASGFGGCNAAVVLSVKNQHENDLFIETQHLVSPFQNGTPFDKWKVDNKNPGTKRRHKMLCLYNSNQQRLLGHLQKKEIDYCIKKSVCIGRGTLTVDDSPLIVSENSFPEFIREAYRKLEKPNRKFFKMDDLSKLGYIAAEYLLSDTLFQPRETGLILANSAASLDTDRKHQEIIDRDGDIEASPAVFVYTLPNVVAGEICIRHKIQGENTFFIMDSYQEEEIMEYALTVMRKDNLSYCIAGWCELLGENYKADFILIERK